MKLNCHLVLATIISSLTAKSTIGHDNGANDNSHETDFTHDIARHHNGSADSTSLSNSRHRGVMTKEDRGGQENTELFNNAEATKPELSPNRNASRKLSQFLEHEINVGTSMSGTKTFILPFSNMLVFPEPINREEVRGTFTVTVTGCTLTVVHEYFYGPGWSTDLKLLGVEVKDPADWTKFLVGHNNQAMPAERQLPEADMNVLPYPVNRQPGFSDTFEVNVDSTTLTVTRNDESSWGGWGQSLELLISPSSAKEPGPRTICESSSIPSSVPSSAPVVSSSSFPTSASDIPSSMPSLAPEASSSSPTVVSSMAPSSPRTLPCVEESAANYYIRTNANAQVKTSKCRALARKKKGKIQKACNETASGSGYFSAKQTCPVTCGTCPRGSCGEIDTARFYDTKLKKRKTCSWLLGRNSNRLKRICDQTLASGGRLVANEVCQSTCGSCPLE